MSTESIQPNSQLEEGTYQILQKRLEKAATSLREKLNQLNAARRTVFGSVETRLLATERVSTEHNCIPQDMAPVGKRFLFGYNVQMGLKKEIALDDVFSLYRYEGHTFISEEEPLLQDGAFQEDFRNLYKYYKDTRFVKFARFGTHLHMVFRIGKNVTDIKTFKWLIDGDSLRYLDNRSEHEVRFPDPYEFRWKKSTRDQQRTGRHPHISIEDKVFVETIGGDLTIKIEDNTEDGQGIYHEPVDYPDQTLDDAEIFYAFVGHLVVLKIRPYQEKDWRYLVFNPKIQTVQRLNGLAQAGLLLPDEQGLLFPNGYYLQTGEYKQFEDSGKNMLFEKRIISPNGEDVLFVFYNREEGLYLLLPYNLIEQEVGTPVYCHGYSIFENGEMCYFRADLEPTRHHTIQIWQTPYTGPNFELPQTSDSYLFKIGNKEIVRAMAELTQLLSLIDKDDSYDGLYHDLIKVSTGLLDHYHWLNQADAFLLEEPLQQVRQTANAALDEFEKVTSIRKNTEQQSSRVLKETDTVVRQVKRDRPKQILEFVEQLNALRRLRGEVISLKELRYVELTPVEAAEQLLQDTTAQTEDACVRFLLQEEALAPYQKKLQQLDTQVAEAPKVAALNQLQKEGDSLAGELEMLLNIVSNLQIEDATETTRIIDSISALYAGLNSTRTKLRNRRKSLMQAEGAAEFSAQLKLIDQSVINYLDVCDTPQKCDEYLTRLMVQLEELEGKFSEFEDYLEKLTTKREEVYAAFENKKVALTEARNKRAGNLQSAGERILAAIQNRLGRFTELAEINGYLAGDLMVEKLRGLLSELQALGDTVKADELRSRLKSLREEAVRQLKDKNELYADGENTIRLGEFAFSVNKQPLELTTLLRDGRWFYHLTGTGFFEPIKSNVLEATKAVWEQSLISENDAVYRAEYLAYQLLQACKLGSYEKTTEQLQQLTTDELRQEVQKYAAARFEEGYVKGVHDADATYILQQLLLMESTAGLLRFAPEVRACGHLYWLAFAEKEERLLLANQLAGAGEILRMFPKANGFSGLQKQLELRVANFLRNTHLFAERMVQPTAAYLFAALSGEGFATDGEAILLRDAFLKQLKQSKGLDAFRQSVEKLLQQPSAAFQLLRQWVDAWLAQQENLRAANWRDELAVLLWPGADGLQRTVQAHLLETMSSLQGEHTLLQNGAYELHYHNFSQKLEEYIQQTVPQFRQLTEAKKQLVQAEADAMRLNEFKPRVMSSFVRNRLIDEVYLPLIGTNLAKQIGTAGENSRTDRQGMLLLISPPGYGKTTLMEYIANRLGLIFMKINGPTLGHEVTSIDPAEAGNAAARQELEKLNLAFEMGDNVMIYVDDIQHCNPEFLQKFISLCDGQRKIEGIWKGRSKTYDFRGRKVAVVMAGNPYTESGEKFRIPDMLANRADIYNLGDILGDNDASFKLSYLENSFTANPVLARIASRSHADALKMVKIAETGQQEGIQWEANHAGQEVQEAVDVLKKLLQIRDVILQVNQAYIHSAGQAEEYRTEPAFKLQGSYRNMNKLGEKVAPVMNEKELRTLILSHYEGESQTLTSGAEANMLKFKEMLGWLSAEEKARWEEIKGVFRKQQQSKGYGNNPMAELMGQIENVSHALYGIRATLAGRYLEDPQENGKGQ